MIETTIVDNSRKGGNARLSGMSFTSSFVHKFCTVSLLFVTTLWVMDHRLSITGLDAILLHETTRSCSLLPVFFFAQQN